MVGRDQSMAGDATSTSTTTPSDRRFNSTEGIDDARSGSPDGSAEVIRDDDQVSRVCGKASRGNVERKDEGVETFAGDTEEHNIVGEYQRKEW